MGSLFEAIEAEEAEVRERVEQLETTFRTTREHERLYTNPDQATYRLTA